MARKTKNGTKTRAARGADDFPVKPEIIIGLVGAAGTDLHGAAQKVIAALPAYGYKGVHIRLSTLMRDVKGGAFLKKITDVSDRIRRHMDAGDAIRDQAKRNDAVVGLAIGWISNYRRDHFDENSADNTAFVVDSLKHPEEIETMRKVYGDRFILISVHSTTDQRLSALKGKIAKSHGTPERADDFTLDAETIMKRDEHDDDHGFGQNVRETFIEGDVYVSTQPKGGLVNDVARYFRVFFGHPFETPTTDEYAMFQTHAAALRSADLGRQVGAAVCTEKGEIIAVGCNEVPKALGGQYGPDDEPDQRDFQLGYDSNTRYRDAALQEAFEKLNDEEQLAKPVDLDRFMAILHTTRLNDITEYGRTVHAEMSALLDAARRGAAVAGHQLFTTTFPCHNCARHIIVAGIEEVVYREPYEKSLASELHKDAIVVDIERPTKGKVAEQEKVLFRRFVGVGPPQYIGLFSMGRRKDPDGQKVEWSEAAAQPRLITTEAGYLTSEQDFLADFSDSIRSVDIGKES